MVELSDLLQVGNILRENFGPNNINTRVVHIRAIVDEDFIVYRYWLKSKQVWRYGVEHRCWYELLLRSGELELTGKGEVHG